MRRHLTVRSAGAALALSLTLVAAGCGSDDNPGAEETTGARSSASPDAAQDKDDATPGTPGGDPTASDSPQAPGSSAPDSDLPEGKDVTAGDLLSMVTDSFARGGSAKVSMKTTGSEAASTSQGVVDYSTTPPSMKLTTTTAMLKGQKSEVLLVGKNLYMNMGDLSDGKYLKMPLDGEAGSTFDVAQLDPAQGFKSFSKGVKTLKVVGKQKVGNLELVRYDAVIDSAKVLGGNKGTAGTDMPKTVNYSFFFDADRMLRRVEMDMGKLGRSTMTYDDWGTKVSVKAPAAKDVMEMPAIPSMPPEPTD